MTEIKVNFAGKEIGVFPLENEKTYTIGRGDDADIKLDAAVVAPLHAKITQGNSNKWEIKTLAESYMLVNGKKIDHAYLTNKSIINIGPFNLSMGKEERKKLDIRSKLSDLVAGLTPRKRIGLLIGGFILAVLFNFLFAGTGDKAPLPEGGKMAKEDSPQQSVEVAQKEEIQSETEGQRKGQNLETQQLTEVLDEDGQPVMAVSALDVSAVAVLSEVEDTGADTQNKQDTLRVKQLRARYISWAEGFIEKENFKEAIVRLNAGIEKLQGDLPLQALLTKTKAEYARKLIKEEKYKLVMKVLEGKGTESKELQDLRAVAQKAIAENNLKNQQLSAHTKTLERKVFVIEKNYLTDDIEAGKIILDEVIADAAIDNMPDLRNKILVLAKQYKERLEQMNQEKDLLSQRNESKVNLARTRYTACLKLKKEKQYIQAQLACREALEASEPSMPERKEINLLLYTLKKSIKEQEFSLMKEVDQCEAAQQWKCVIQKLQIIQQANNETPEVTQKVNKILAQQRIKARSLYQDGLSYESVGNLTRAEEIWSEVMGLLPEKEPYFEKARKKLDQLR